MSEPTPSVGFTPTPYDPTDDGAAAKAKKQIQMGGRPIDFLPVSFYIRALNKVFPFRWHFDFAALDGTKNPPYTIIPSNTLENQPAFPATGTVAVLGTLTITDADGPHTYQEVGAKPYKTLEDFRNQLKASISDARKRTARLLGDQFGNSLRDGGDVEDDASEHEITEHHFDDMPPEEREQVTAHVEKAYGAHHCSKCGKTCTNEEAEYSQDHFKRILCRVCQDRARKAKS